MNRQDFKKQLHCLIVTETKWSLLHCCQFIQANVTLESQTGLYHSDKQQPASDSLFNASLEEMAGQVWNCSKYNSTEKGDKVRGGIKTYIRMVCFLLRFFSRTITSVRSPMASSHVSQRKPYCTPWLRYCRDNLSPKCWGMCKGRFPFNQPSWFSLPTLFYIVTRDAGIWIPALIQFETGIDNWFPPRVTNTFMPIFSLFVIMFW